MSSLKSSVFVPLCLLALCLIVLSGCDDTESRSKADEAIRQTMALKSQLDDSKKKTEDLEASVKAVETRLKAYLDDRISKISDEVSTNHKRVLEQVSQDVKMTRDTATKMSENARADNDKELTATKALLAENMQNIRGELKDETEKLRKFMDNQLKETYPYAYQPRRLDPASPPGEPAPPAPKKEAEAPK